MRDHLNGKVSLITGASRALGAEIARTMARYGAEVIVNYHHSRDAALALCNELAAGGGKARAIQADVTRPDEVERLVSESGTVDILVNNVGPYADAPWLDLTLADFDRILEGNLRSTFMMSRAAGTLMKRRGRGHIVNITATDVFHRSHSIYGLAKSALVHLTEGMALELAPEVCVNAVAPDLIADNEDMPDELPGRAISATPLGKLISRAEIAEVVCLLCTPAFAMMTGRTIILDGGRTIPRVALGKGD